jgi:hypothetical protein
MAAMNRIRENINNGDHGLAHYTALQMQAQKDEFAKMMTADPDLGRIFLTMDFLKQYPDWAKQFFGNMASDYDIAKLQPQLRAIVNSFVVKSLTPNGEPIKKAYENISTYTGGSGGAPEANRAVLKAASLMDDPKTPTEYKINEAHSWFQQANQGFLANVKDQNDRFKIYDSLTSASKIAVTSKVGGNTWKEHRDWAINEFQDSLLTRELNELPEFAEGSHSYKIAWNDKTHQFILDTPKIKNYNNTNYKGFFGSRGTGVTQEDSPKLQYLADTVNRINHGLEGLTRIMEADGRNVNSELLHIMNQVNPRTKFYESLYNQGKTKIPDKIESEK